jgi:DNA-binding LytR/AlgR family response regulator
VTKVIRIEHFLKFTIIIISGKLNLVVNNKIDQLIKELKQDSGLFLSISFGLFIFVLFFQPFPFEISDSNNMLLLIAGLGGIIFLFMVLIRVVIPWLSVDEQERKEKLFPSYFSGFIIFVMSSLAFIFYIRYVGSVAITFYITFKVLTICLAPSVILGLHDSFKEIRDHNRTLIAEKKKIQQQIENYEEDILNKTIEFISENISDNFSLLIGEIAFIRSADNYVEIVYKEGEAYRKKLIRNTLKNIETQIRQYTNFIRCHRICIVNVHFIEKLNRNGSSYWLKIKDYDSNLPVSRQYLLKVKDAI